MISQVEVGFLPDANRQTSVGGSFFTGVKSMGDFYVDFVLPLALLGLVYAVVICFSTIQANDKKKSEEKFPPDPTDSEGEEEEEVQGSSTPPTPSHFLAHWGDQAERQGRMRRRNIVAMIRTLDQSQSPIDRLTHWEKVIYYILERQGKGVRINSRER